MAKGARSSQKTDLVRPSPRLCFYVGLVTNPQCLEPKVQSSTSRGEQLCTGQQRDTHMLASQEGQAHVPFT